MNEQFGDKAVENFMRTAQIFISSKKLVQKNDIYTLTTEGLFISDNIISEFIII
jgi:hypothetical protein